MDWNYQRLPKIWKVIFFEAEVYDVTPRLNDQRFEKLYITAGIRYIPLVYRDFNE